MRIRLMISMLVVVGITIASVVGFAMFSTQREVNTYMLRGGMFGLNELVNRLEDYYTRQGSWEGAAVVANDLMMPERGRGMRMMGGNSNQNNQNNSTDPQVAQVAHVMLTDTSGSTLINFRGKADITQLTQTQLDLAIALKDQNGNLIGYLYTDESAPIQPGGEQALTEKLFSSVQKAALIGVGIAILSSLFLGYWFLKPVQQLTRAATELGKGDLNQRVSAEGKDELAQLGKTFNQMAESLQRAEDSRKAMTADIAHELRTPLAVQRATVEAMLDGVYPLDEDSLQPVLEQNLLLARLVDDLRTLALADAGELRLDKVETDIARVAASVMNRFQSQAGKTGIMLEFHQSDENIVSVADPIRLEQILTNLMGNAIRFTPSGGTIRMEVTNQANLVEVTVKDSGTGIPDDSLPYIFDRFYRVDKARNREEGGSGLGLAIARQLARAQSGDLTARNHPNGGAEFRLTLPR